MSGNNGQGTPAGRITKVCILTSVHHPFDTRVFHREAISLAGMGYEVHLVAPGKENDVVHGVHLHAISQRNGRGSRMTQTALAAYRLGLGLGADVYHFHDPELIPFGILLKLRGKRVIYDAHEDLPKDILDKPWIAPWLRRPVALAAGAIEKLAARLLDRVVAATPAIARRFPKRRTSVVQNFPISNLLWSPNTPYSQRSPRVVYAGGIVGVQGAREMVMAIGMLPAQPQPELALAGPWETPELKVKVSSLPGWSRVHDLGVLSQEGVRDLLGKSRVGLLIYYPIANSIEAQPRKLYEYMSAAIPVVTSNFPLWKEIVEGSGCGLTVDPLDPKAIAEAIEYLLEHPGEAEEMGRRGRDAVLRHYNWQEQAKVLGAVYEELLKR